MLSLRRSSLLLAAALCVLAGDLAAQRTQRVTTQAAQRLRDEGVTLRVGAAGIDTLTARTGNLRVQAGDMIVNVTGEGATRVRPPRVAVRPGLAPALVPDNGSAAPNVGSTPEPAPEPARPRPDPVQPRPSREEPAVQRPRREEPAPERPKREEPAPERPRRDEPAPERPKREEPAPRPDPAPEEAPAPDASAPIAYELGYEIGMGSPEAENFHILVPIVEIEGGGLRYDPAQQAYVGTILFGLVDRDHPAETGNLPNRVRLQISGDVQSLDAVELSQINIPFRQIALRVQRPRADSVLVRIRPTFDPTGGSVISIPILRAPLTLQASPRRIAGFGLEISELAIQALRRGDTLPVVISSTRAKPNPALLKATHDGAMSRVRSSGVGVDTVRVASGDFEELIVIQYAWPIAFLLAALFGGLIGGVLNALSTKRHSDPRTIAFLGAQGALTGGVAAVLYAVGINVVGWAPSAEYGEGLMFAVAFISGLMGPRIFDRFLPKLSVGRKDGDDAAAPPAPPPAPAAPPAPAPEPAAVG
jgi:outer membrane biosynthesis protein TonB